MQQDESKPNLADAMLNGIMAALTDEQMCALGPLLQAGRLTSLINALHVLAADIEAQTNPPANAPEPQRLPGVGDDDNLLEWLKAEREVSNGPH